MQPLHALLQGLIDYAGLFPPARLDMEATVHNYAAYSRGPRAWMLGRLIVPVARLEEFEAAAAELLPGPTEVPWRLSVLPTSDLRASREAIRAFGERHRHGVLIDAVELLAPDPERIREALEVLPRDLQLFFELSLDSERDWPALLDALRQARSETSGAGLGGERVHAKARTGGVTEDALPSSAKVARFLLAVHRAGVPFKATAGLHHALRGKYRLTYEPDSPHGTMHGFLNLFLAALLIRAGKLQTEDAAVSLLETRDAEGLELTAEGLSWNGLQLSNADLEAGRGAFAISYGSCSFEEPLDDLEHLNLLIGGPVESSSSATHASEQSRLDASHDAARRSWVESANAPGTDFPLQNLPFGVFRHDDGPVPHIGVAIGDQVLDLQVCFRLGLFEGLPAARAVDGYTSLNFLMSLPREERLPLRHRLFELLATDATPQLRDTVARALYPLAEVELVMPVQIGDYTDFYASVHHATNVGSMFRPDNPLLPNYKYIPVGYHGRASSVVVSGTPVRRPLGQRRPDPDAPPSFGPSRLLDYELEVGLLVGPGNGRGRYIGIDGAEEHLFGLTLVNDWSARDLQAWEYQPLGPFLAKSFATSMSPWVVTTEALAPFRVSAFERPEGDPAPLQHLHSEHDQQAGAFDVQLEVYLLTPRMRQEGLDPARLSRGNFRHMYWTPAQMITHHTSNGCNLQAGDLLASGTVSGPDKDSRGCLLELTWRGKEPIQLPNGEERKFLQDGDELILRGYCEREGFTRIGFGECRGKVEAAPQHPHSEN